jgi:hypothetical protein
MRQFYQTKTFDTETTTRPSDIRGSIASSDLEDFLMGRFGGAGNTGLTSPPDTLFVKTEGTAT